MTDSTRLLLKYCGKPHRRSSNSPLWPAACLCLLMISAASRAQYHIAFPDKVPSGLDHATHKYADRPAAERAIQHWYTSLLALGYLDARVDTIWQGQEVKVEAEFGTVFSWGTIELVNPAGKRIPNSLAELPGTSVGNIPPFAKWLDQMENLGHPFAQIHLDSILLRDSLVDLRAILDPGPMIQWDSLRIRSRSTPAARFVTHYTGFRKGDPYSEAWFAGLEKRLREIPFLQVSGKPEVVFRKSGADVYCYVERKKSNYFNGILGIQPDAVSGRINITGDAEVLLQNALNGGEEFYFRWRKLQVKTQDLEARIRFPFLLGLPVGAEGKLSIYRRDSTFSTAATSLSLFHLTRGVNQVSAFVKNNRSIHLRSTAGSAGLADIDNVMFGLGVVQEDMDYRINPRRGYGLRVEGSAGRKTATAIATENAEAEVRMNQYGVEGLAEWYLPVFRRQVVRAAVAGGGIFAEKIYFNELFRLGGNRTIRGFDEESIPASSYSILTLEYRLLFEENAHVFAFLDQGWYEAKSTDHFESDTPLGFGAGVRFETKAGLFAVSYALGSQFGQPILVRNAKIAFGFRNTF